MSTSAIQPITAGGATAALASAAAKSSATALSQSPQASQSIFLQLLVAQLKNQDPENHADGTQFVTQLAQFTTLEQTTQGTSDLNQILKAMQTAAAATATSSPATKSSTQS
jgi:flagellar basal-body rod modification protein FlgD